MNRPPRREMIGPHALVARPATHTSFKVQRRCACGGGCPACRETAALQAKLEIGDPDDRFEREADRVAREVMGGWPAQQLAVPRVQRMADSGLELEEEDKAAIRTKPAAAPSAHASRLTPPHVASITNPASGTRLPEPARAVMEERFGSDFGAVRIHTGDDAADLNARLSSRAFTYGRDIWFGAGESPSDLPLLAHELVHVLQQNGYARRLVQRQTLTPAQLGSITALTLPGGGVLPEEFMSLWLIPQQCDPFRALTLADFAEDASLPAGMAGRTRADIVSITVHGVAGFGAKFLSTSALLPSHKHPDDRSKSPCGTLVKNCVAEFNAGRTAFSFSNKSKCAAAPSLAGRATSVDECESVCGADCDKAAKEDSTRVLAHEQLHFDIACVVVAKANLAFWRAGLPAHINVAAIKKVKDKVNSDYDRDTGHGCDPAQQQAWEDRVRRQFLPGVKF
jgi:hypothetical protein